MVAAAGLISGALAVTAATAAPVQFDITAASFATPGGGYGVDANETAMQNPTLLDVKFSTSIFAAQSFMLTDVDPNAGSAMTFNFGTVTLDEPSAGGGILAAETDGLGVEGKFTFTNPLGSMETVTAVGTAVTGSVADAAVDYTLTWTPLVVNFGVGGSFRISLDTLTIDTNNDNNNANRRTQTATITLLSMPEPPAPELPEPATLALFGFGLAGLGFMRRRRAA